MIIMLYVNYGDRDGNINIFTTVPVNPVNGDGNKKSVVNSKILIMLSNNDDNGDNVDVCNCIMKYNNDIAYYNNNNNTKGKAL